MRRCVHVSFDLEYLTRDEAVIFGTPERVDKGAVFKALIECIGGLDPDFVSYMELRNFDVVRLPRREVGRHAMDSPGVAESG